MLIDLPMPIYTPRLLIRPPQMGDGEIINAAIVESYDELKLTMPWAQTCPSVEETELYIRQAVANWILKKNEDPWLPLFIFDRNTHSFIGGTGFNHINWDVPCLETGYWIRKGASGNGFIIEAINALTQYAIKEIGAKRIEIRCDITNTESKKIPARLGFQLESIQRANRINPKSKKVSDTLLYTRHSLHELPELLVSWG